MNGFISALPKAIGAVIGLGAPILLANMAVKGVDNATGNQSGVNQKQRRAAAPPGP